MVDFHLMELFRKFDLSDAEITDEEGKLIGYDETVLNEFADFFIDVMTFLGVLMPSRVEIVQEYLRLNGID